MKSIVYATVYSNIWIALGASSLYIAISILNGLHVDISFFWIIFLSTLCSYQLQRLARIKYLKEIKSDRIIWLVNNKRFLWFLFFVSTAILVYFFLIKNKIMHWYIIVALSVISGAYTTLNLRKVAYIKIILISLSWALLIGIYPFVHQLSFEKMMINLVLAFAYIMAITIPFDIRDLKFDNSNQKTIPQVFGIQKAKLIAYINLIVHTLVLLLFFRDKNNLVGLFILINLLSFFLIKNSSANKKDWYYSAYIDGLLILYLLSIFIKDG